MKKAKLISDLVEACRIAYNIGSATTSRIKWAYSNNIIKDVQDIAYVAGVGKKRYAIIIKEYNSILKERDKNEK